MHRQNHILIIVATLAFVLALCGCNIVKPRDSDDMAQTDEWVGRRIALDMHVDSVTFLPDDRRVVLVSNLKQRLAIMDIQSSDVIRTFNYRDEFGETSISNVAVDTTGRYIYVVGEGRVGLVARLDLESFEWRVIRFEDGFLHPSIAVSTEGRVFVGDAGSSILSIVDSIYFNEKVEGRVLSRADLCCNIYLEKGPASDIRVSRDGRVVLISHIDASLLTLVDTEAAATVDETGPGDPYPLLIDFAQWSDRQWAEDRMTAVIVDITEDLLVVADLDWQFRKFGDYSLAPIDLNAKIPNEKVKSPLILAVSNNLDTIVVAARNQRHAVVFVRAGRTLENLGMIDLEDLPQDVDITSDGSMITYLTSDHMFLAVIHNPFSPDPTVLSRSGSDLVRNAQRMLSELHYPVEVVDGFVGQSTKRAIEAFQRAANLRVTGKIDDRTLEQLRKVWGELPEPRPRGKEEVDGVLLSGKDCVRLEEENRCSWEKREAFVSSIDSRTTEVICKSWNTSMMPVQIDTYSGDQMQSPPKYICTSYHSCAYIQFRDLFAFDNLCVERETKKRR